MGWNLFWWSINIWILFCFQVIFWTHSMIMLQFRLSKIYFDLRTAGLEKGINFKSWCIKINSVLNCQPIGILTFELIFMHWYIEWSWLLRYLVKMQRHENKNAPLEFKLTHCTKTSQLQIHSAMYHFRKVLFTLENNWIEFRTFHTLLVGPENCILYNSIAKMLLLKV